MITNKRIEEVLEEILKDVPAGESQMLIGEEIMNKYIEAQRDEFALGLLSFLEREGFLDVYILSNESILEGYKNSLKK